VLDEKLCDGIGHVRDRALLGPGVGQRERDGLRPAAHLLGAVRLPLNVLARLIEHVLERRLLTKFGVQAVPLDQFREPVTAQHLLPDLIQAAFQLVADGWPHHALGYRALDHDDRAGLVEIGEVDGKGDGRSQHGRERDCGDERATPNDGDRPDGNRFVCCGGWILAGHGFLS
jgi:hypothetical protein